MPVMNGLDAIRRLREKDPHVRAVVLTMHDGRDTAVSAFRAGALGYVLKTSSEEEFSTAIAEVSEGRPWISPLVTDDPVSIIAEACRPGGEGGERLTPRQREVLDLIAEGRTMKEIAAILNMSPRTAESHKYGIMQALGVNTTAALVRYATKDRMIKG
jgi:DNA-binding NarL/FixJ family response regulator